jgi:cytochrome oxidase assembly protein ShyY1
VFRLLFSSRWMGYLALTIVFAVVASLFGLWQWDRRSQAVEAMDRVENNYDTSPITLDAFILAAPIVTQANEWAPLVLEGVYLQDEQVLVRTRPRAGQVGFEVLVPFRTSTGTVIIARGWVPTGESRDFPDEIPAPPSGNVEVMGRVKMWEPQLRGRGAPDGQVATINLTDVQQQSSDSLLDDFYIIAGSENPSPASLPLRAIKPVLDEGPHLSYTFQWFLFALMAFVGYGWLFRQDLQLSRGVIPKPQKNITDAQEEDALLEDQRH